MVRNERAFNAYTLAKYYDRLYLGIVKRMDSNEWKELMKVQRAKRQEALTLKHEQEKTKGSTTHSQSKSQDKKKKTTQSKSGGDGGFGPTSPRCVEATTRESLFV